MRRSPLSNYVQCLRARRGFSVDFIAAKADLKIIEYIKFEENPEKTPLSICAKFFNILNLSKMEFVDFQVISRLANARADLAARGSEELDPNRESNLKESQNVVSLRGMREMANPTESNSEGNEC